MDIFSFNETKYRIEKLGGNARHNEVAENHLKQMIGECEELYPGIDLWYKKKVAPDLEKGTRSAILIYDGNDPVGSAVIRNDNKAKLCSMRIKPGMQHSFLGHYLMDLVALNLRNKTGRKGFTETVHFTLPESMWTDYGSFFKKYGFTCHGEASGQYRLFDKEFACSAKFTDVLNQALIDIPEVLPQLQIAGEDTFPEVLMSIMPTYVDKILSGKKTVEIRTKFSSRWKGSRVILYASSPRRELSGECTIEDITTDTPNEIWDRFGDSLGCSHDEYLKYCGKHIQVSALKFKNVQPYFNPISRAQLEVLMAKELKPPMSYLRIFQQKGWLTAVSLSKLLRTSV